MIEKVDLNGNNCVDIDEFSELYRSLMGDKDEEEDMKEAFNVFDQNGDGYISVDELRFVLVSLGQQERTVDECQRMIPKVDVDVDGRVNFMEFTQMMKGGGGFSALV
ncbi:hypothetical protein Goshw_028297 [Gossypium schwendimanii]|uniref:EF-hand domain-containing protein n=1 Tax=Gossypium schwendimanii TaxID=34291 RepID=A0A7J9LIE5_GOSSC|nr:hypothetical protein [Gossypium schwendimanii]